MSRALQLQQQLRQDIQEMGYPTINIHRHGFSVEIHTAGYHVSESNFVFTALSPEGINQEAIHISLILMLQKITRPDHAPGLTPQKCYRLIDDSGHQFCYIYWP